jgi:DNA polymerase III subunit alpha
MIALPRALQAAESKAGDRKRGQKNLLDIFDTGDEDAPTPGKPAKFGEGVSDAPEWPELEKLKFEKEALDFYISSHPLVQFDDQLRVFRTHTSAEVSKLNVGTEVRLAGMVTNFETRVIKGGRNKGTHFAIFRLEDFQGQTKLVMWSEVFTRFKELVVDDKILLFEGKVERREGASEPDVIVEKVMTIEEAKQELTRGMVIRIPYTEDDDLLKKLDGVATILRRNKGSCPVYLSIKDFQNRSVQFKLGNDFFVNVAKFHTDELEMLLGQGCVLYTGR